MTGTEVTKIRQDLGLSQSEFAEALGVHMRSVSRWETKWWTGTIPRAMSHHIRLVAATLTPKPKKGER